MPNAFFILLMKLVPAMLIVVAFVALAMNIGIDFQAIMNAEYLDIPKQ